MYNKTDNNLPEPFQIFDQFSSFKRLGFLCSFSDFRQIMVL